MRRRSSCTALLYRVSLNNLLLHSYIILLLFLQATQLLLRNAEKVLFSPCVTSLGLTLNKGQRCPDVSWTIFRSLIYQAYFLCTLFCSLLLRLYKTPFESVEVWCGSLKNYGISWQLIVSGVIVEKTENSLLDNDIGERIFFRCTKNNLVILPQFFN